MKNILAILLCVSLIFGCTSENQESENYYFVTRLGNDTLAIERITEMENALRADVVLRSPRISLNSYQISWSPANQLQEMQAVRYDNAFGAFPEGGTTIQQIEAVGDSLIIESEGRNGTVRRAMLNDKSYLPFIDMVHWPYDIAFERAHQSANDSTHQYLLTGRRASDFIIHRTADEEYTLRHPSRGVMYVQTNNEGQLTWLDAKETTRKLIVERISELDFDRLTERYIEIDKQGSPFGTLSPAVESEFTVKGTDFKLTYGSPQKRGRSLFGGIVPYGERWRTGANRASHFSTSNDIYISGNRVPAGEYTLFTIPEEDGGTLIINKQTGQNGQSYDSSRDLMRVPMMRTENTEDVEGFTLQVVESNQGGSLEILWGESIFYVDFKFQP